jgi:hypothetical protein
MGDDKTPGPILSPAAAKQRFFLYLGIKLLGLLAFFGGVFLSRDGAPVALVAIALLVGAVSLFVRPRHLGLTTRPER